MSRVARCALRYEPPAQPPPVPPPGTATGQRPRHGHRHAPPRVTAPATERDGVTADAKPRPQTRPRSPLPSMRMQARVLAALLVLHAVPLLARTERVRAYVPPPEGKAPFVASLRPTRGSASGGTTVSVFGARLAKLRSASSASLFCVFGASHAIPAVATAHPDVVVCGAPSAEDAGVASTGGFATVRLASSASASDGGAVTDGASDGATFAFVAADGSVGKHPTTHVSSARVARAGGTILTLRGGAGAGMRRDAGWACAWRADSAQKQTSQTRTALHVTSSVIAQCEAPAAPAGVAAWRVSVTDVDDMGTGARAVDARVVEARPTYEGELQRAAAGVRVPRARLRGLHDETDVGWCAFGSTPRAMLAAGNGVVCPHTLAERTGNGLLTTIEPLPQTTRIGFDGLALFLQQARSTVTLPKTLAEKSQTMGTQDAEACASFRVFDKHGAEPLWCRILDGTASSRKSAVSMRVLGGNWGGRRVLEVACACAVQGVASFSAIALEMSDGFELARAMVQLRPVPDPWTLGRSLVIQPSVVAPFDMTSVSTSIVATVAGLGDDAMVHVDPCRAFDTPWLAGIARGSFVSSRVASCELLLRSHTRQSCSSCSLRIVSPHEASKAHFNASESGGTLIGPLPSKALARQTPANNLGCRFGAIGPVALTPLEAGEMGCHSVARKAESLDELWVQVGTSVPVGSIQYASVYAVIADNAVTPSSVVQIYVRALEDHGALFRTLSCTIRRTTAAVFVALSALACDTSVVFAGADDDRERHALILRQHVTSEHAVPRSELGHATAGAMLLADTRYAPSDGGVRIMVSLWTRSDHNTAHDFLAHLGTIGAIAGQRESDTACSFIMPASSPSHRPVGASLGTIETAVYCPDSQRDCTIDVLELWSVRAFADMNIDDVRAGQPIRMDAVGPLNARRAARVDGSLLLEVPSSHAFPNDNFFVALSIAPRPASVLPGTRVYVQVRQEHAVELQAHHQSAPFDSGVVERPRLDALTMAFALPAPGDAAFEGAPVLRSSPDGGVMIRHVIQAERQVGAPVVPVQSACMFGTIGPVMAAAEDATERTCVAPAMAIGTAVEIHAGTMLQMPAARFASAAAIARVEYVKAIPRDDDGNDNIAGDEEVEWADRWSPLAFDVLEVPEARISESGGDVVSLRVHVAELDMPRCHFGSVSVVGATLSDGTLTCTTPALAPDTRKFGLSEHTSSPRFLAFPRDIALTFESSAPTALVLSAPTGHSASLGGTVPLRLLGTPSGTGFAKLLQAPATHASFFANAPSLKSIQPAWLPFSADDGGSLPSVRFVTGQDLGADVTCAVSGETMVLYSVSSVFGRCEVFLRSRHGHSELTASVIRSGTSLHGTVESLGSAQVRLWGEVPEPALVHEDGGTSISVPAVGTIPPLSAACHFGVIGPVRGTALADGDVTCISPALGASGSYGASDHQCQDVRRFGRKGMTSVQRRNAVSVDREVPLVLEDKTRRDVEVFGTAVEGVFTNSIVCRIGECSSAVRIPRPGSYSCQSPCGHATLGFSTVAVSLGAFDAPSIGETAISMVPNPVVMHAYPPELALDGSQGAAYVAGAHLMPDRGQITFGGIDTPCSFVSSALMACSVPATTVADLPRTIVAWGVTFAVGTWVPLRAFARSAMWERLDAGTISSDFGGDDVVLRASRSSGSWNCAVGTVGPLKLVARDGAGAFGCKAPARAPGDSWFFLGAANAAAAVLASDGPALRVPFAHSADNEEPPMVPNPIQLRTAAANATGVSRIAHVYPNASPAGGGVVATLRFDGRGPFDWEATEVEFAADDGEHASRRAQLAESCVALSSTLLRCEVPSARGAPAAADGRTALTASVSFFGERYEQDAVVTPQHGPSSGGTPVKVTSSAAAPAVLRSVPLQCRFDSIVVAARPCDDSDDGCLRCVSPAHAPSRAKAHPLKPRPSTRASSVFVGAHGGAAVPGRVGSFLYHPNQL